MGNGKRFLIAKNELLKRYTGMILIPENQIIDDEKYDNLKLDITESDSNICTYCHVHSMKYYNNPFMEEVEAMCMECPMYIAGNNCENYDSTYGKIIRDFSICVSSKISPWYNELVVLVDEYNKNSKYEDKQNALLDNSSK